MSSRPQNERKFSTWQEQPNGNRLYWLDVQGRYGWRARYLKEVDPQENTIRFWQEIFDDRGELVEIHQKFPTDDGHQKV